MTKKIEQETRRIFDSHHREQSRDEKIYQRLVSLVNTDYFQVPSDYFKDKVVLDIGCGSNANASYAFLKMGATVVSADIGTEWMDCAKQKLSPFKPKSILKGENVLDMDFKDNEFDFVHCAGVLHHTENPEKGFRELVRVTKPKGMTFISIMACKGGVLYDIINFLRDKYQQEETFARIIDDLTIEKLQKELDWLLWEKEKVEGCSGEEKAFIKGLFNEDFILTIKDRLQAPTYQNFDFTEEQIRGWFCKYGLENIKRITRYPKGFENIRRYISPLYYYYATPLAKFVFGDGYVQMIGVKK